MLSNFASSDPSSLAGSPMNCENCSTKSFSVAATARSLPLWVFLNSASSMSTILPSPSFTMSAICGAHAWSRRAGFLMISAKATMFFGSESMRRIASPALLTIASPTIVLSEKTRFATKSLTAASPPMSFSDLGGSAWTGWGIALTTLLMSPAIEDLTMNSPSGSMPFASGMFATLPSISFISGGKSALSLTSFAWKASSFAFVLPTSLPSSARSASSTSMPVL